MTSAAVPLNVSNLRAELRQARDRLRESHLTSLRPKAYFAAHIRLIDTAVRSVRRHFRMPDQMTLVAVGGYGRGEQYPHSDVDLLVLLPAAPEAADAEGISSFLCALRDAGLDLGYAVRTVEECVEDARQDITIQTTLLETRFLDGSRPLYGELRAAIEADLDPAAFFEAKCLEQQLRHDKQQNSPFSLEPNVKEGAGGLRDLHVVRWVMRAAGLAGTWQELAERGFINAIEARALAGCDRLLQQTRIRLHWLTPRKNEVLRFEFQPALAEQNAVTAIGSRIASEVYMQRYYRNTKRVMQLNTILLQNIAAALTRQDANVRPTVLNERFQASRDLLDIRSPQMFEQDPAALLDCFLVLQQHPELKGLSARSLRALWLARGRIDVPFRRNPGNRRRFLDILRQPRGIVHELR
nr:nucleotidyltransferase domain-containing protein [Methylotetracoccus sp.]